MKRLRFDRTKRKGWMLAFSYDCPLCRGRLYGDKTFAWCKAFDCEYVVEWEMLKPQPIYTLKDYYEKIEIEPDCHARLSSVCIVQNTPQHSCRSRQCARKNNVYRRGAGKN